MADCPICNNERYISKVNADDEVERTLCSCQIEEYRKQLFDLQLKSSRIPSECWQYTMDTFPYQYLLPFDKSGVTCVDRPRKKQLDADNAPSFIRLKEYVSNPQAFIAEKFKVLWIWGEDPNTGHTASACALGVSLLKKGYKVRYYEMQGLIKLIMEYQDRDVVAEMAIAADKFDVFIINDAFDRSRSSVSNNEYLRANLFGFFQNVLSRDKKIICTSDVDIDGIPEAYTGLISTIIRSYSGMHIRGTLNSMFKAQR